MNSNFQKSFVEKRQKIKKKCHKNLKKKQKRTQFLTFNGATIKYIKKARTMVIEIDPKGKMSDLF